MCKIAIVEDVAFERRQLVEYLRQYEKEKGLSFQLMEFGDVSELIADYPADLDILFMDIIMENVEGMQTAKWVRQRDKKVILFFATSMVQYAIQGYRVEAMDFLVKPVSYTGLKVRLDRAILKLRKDTPRKLVLRNQEGVHSLDIEEVCYIETANHKVLVHTKDGRVITANSTMQTLEKELAGLPFYRCHASFLVNLNYVERIQGNDIWVNGNLLSVSRYRRADFWAAWTAFLGEQE
ncbi:MAG: LytTR family DNA-binding domain-containing protein [Lachnospiraceae bacterium]|nr:LytTR family DNA-binding domain-containing protein [Lachnospiraceae bacterium]